MFCVGGLTISASNPNSHYGLQRHKGVHKFHTVHRYTHLLKKGLDIIYGTALVHGN